MEFDQIPVPDNCKACADACPMKRVGCAFDLAREVLQLHEVLAAEAVDLAPEEALAELAGRAKECHKTVVTEVMAENKDRALAEKILKRLLPTMQNGMTQNLVRVVEKQPEPEPVAEPAPEQSQVAVLAPPAPVKKPVPPATSKSDLYLDPEDQELEAQLLADDTGVYGVCTTPKLRVDNISSHVEDYLKPAMAEAPFEGLIAAIPKRHANNPNLVRITAFYRGPAPGEAMPILKERKKALLGV